MRSIMLSLSSPHTLSFEGLESASYQLVGGGNEHLAWKLACLPTDPFPSRTAATCQLFSSASQSSQLQPNTAQRMVPSTVLPARFSIPIDRYLRVYIYIYTHTYTKALYIYIYIYMQACVHIYIYEYVRIQVCRV